MEVKHTQGIGTTYLYQANTEEVGHGSEVREGVVWRWREAGAYFGVPTQALLGKCPAKITSHSKEVSMSWNH